MAFNLISGDCLSVLAELPESGIDAVVTDPPYELGFMGKSWDASGVAFSPDTWRLVWRVMKPGAHLVAFGAPKNYHRLACAIEDAGFEIRDSLMWVFGSGFPKSLDVSKAIDKAAGAEREVVGKRTDGRYAYLGCDITGGKTIGGSSGTKEIGIITSPATDAAREWDGWGTALKPAYEPIVLARKPLSEGTVAANVLRWGTGAINIDKSRISTEDQRRDERVYKRLSSLYSACGSHGLSEASSLYWLRCISSVLRSGNTGSINLSHDAAYQDDTLPDPALCEFVAIHLFPNGVWCGLNSKSKEGSQADCPSYHRLNDAHVHQLEALAQEGATSLADALAHICEEQSTPSHIHATDTDRLCSSSVLSFVLWKTIQVYLSLPKQSSRWPANLCHDGSHDVLDLFPHTKSGNLSPHHKLKASDNLSMSGGNYERNPRQEFGGDEGSAARFFYCAKASKHDRAGSKHPTVKPVALMRWLARLVAPPGGTILDPFAGSGTTGQAAIEEGFNVTLIEREAEYIADIERRLSPLVTAAE